MPRVGIVFRGDRILCSNGALVIYSVSNHVQQVPACGLQAQLSRFFNS